MRRLLIKDATIVNECRQFIGDILIENQRIHRIGGIINPPSDAEVIEAAGLHAIPGVIDDQVHFREPGLTHKASIATESRAAVAGGVTTFMEMPNTLPPALTQDLLEEKYAIAAKNAAANYSFFMGVSNDNLDEVLRTNGKKNTVCGIKVFMGSSTGDMLVDNHLTLNKIFSEAELLIATHCEDERIIAENKKKYPNPTDASFHPLIRNEESCFESSLTAIQLAKKHDARLHILHISTERELQLFSNLLPLAQKRITSEVCVHHLHFTADDYASLNTRIKCNPAIKAPHHRDALWTALLDDRLDVIATDHAPHTLREKEQPYLTAPAGLPLVQHPLLLMLDYVHSGRISLEKVVHKMSHAPAICFQIAERGFLREGYFADIVLVNLKKQTVATRDSLHYKCGWSPFEGHVFQSSVAYTIVNGVIACREGVLNDQARGMRVSFER